LNEKNENLFKETAYKNGKVFIRIVYPDGISKNVERNVRKKWSTSVYWNINSMPSQYNGL
jgi:hypothetical protein